jgi:hypothetical protein
MPTRCIAYDLEPGDYELRLFHNGCHCTTPIRLETAGVVTITLTGTETVDIKRTDMKSTIIITKPWTNEDGTAHAAGEVVAVEGYILSREEHYGISGKYRFPRPWEHVAPGQTAPVEAPPNPADESAATGPAPATEAPRRAAKAATGDAEHG